MYVRVYECNLCKHALCVRLCLYVFVCVFWGGVKNQREYGKL